MKSMRDYIDLIEGRIDELSQRLVQRAQAKRHRELTDRSETGEMRSTGAIQHGKSPNAASVNHYHDTEDKWIENGHREESRKSQKPIDRAVMDQQKADNARERARNLKRGAAINTANRKLNGSARVPAKK